jgi:hypothetical protein
MRDKAMRRYTAWLSIQPGIEWRIEKRSLRSTLGSLEVENPTFFARDTADNLFRFIG